MRGRKRTRRWLWSLVLAASALPLSAQSGAHQPSEIEAARVLAQGVRRRGEASLQDAAHTAVHAVAALEAAHVVVHQVAHGGDQADALADCQGRWGSELGPVLCPAMFVEESAVRGRPSVEVRLLGALWHIAERHAGVLWRRSHAAAGELWVQVRALGHGDDAP